MSEQIADLIKIASKLQNEANGMYESAGSYAAIELVTRILKMAENRREDFIGLQLAMDGDIKNALKIITSKIDYRNDNLKSIKNGRPKSAKIQAYFEWIAGDSDEWIKLSERSRYNVWKNLENSPIFHINKQLFSNETFRLKQLTTIAKSTIPESFKEIAREGL